MHIEVAVSSTSLCVDVVSGGEGMARVIIARRLGLLLMFGVDEIREIAVLWTCHSSLESNGWRLTAWVVFDVIDACWNLAVTGIECGIPWRLMQKAVFVGCV